MGRTISSFRIVLGMEKAEWKPFRNALDKSDKKHFDDIWDILDCIFQHVPILVSWCHFTLSLYRYYFTITKSSRNASNRLSKQRGQNQAQISFSDNNQIVETIEKSSNQDSLDKLKPVNCLSTFANLEPKEQFLIRKKISTKIKEVGTFLAVIIPVLITVLQLAFPQFFPKS